MSKPKAALRDYDADLRFAPPPPENATRKELLDRAHWFVKVVLSGAGYGPEKPKAEKT